MPFKDSEKAREYFRTYQRQRRAGLTHSTTINLSGSVKVKTAQDVLVVLERLLDELLSSDIDVVIRCRTATYMAATLLKALEVAEIESRLEQLEETLNTTRNVA